MLFTKRVCLLAVLCIALGSCQTIVGEETIRQQVLDHSQAIRDAFAAGDLERIAALHHPDVQKALGYDDVQSGRDEVMAGLTGTLGAYALTFVENDVEHIFLHHDLAIEQTRFSIRGTPNDGDEPFTFSGRTMVTYVRHADSPTGWATIREIIQPMP